jgi:hypothetical protein
MEKGNEWIGNGAQMEGMKPIEKMKAKINANCAKQKLIAKQFVAI